MTTDGLPARAAEAETDHGTISVEDIRPSPENDRLYRPVDPTDPAIVTLSESIAEHGVLEPLVITSDGFIISGHRRHAAAKLAGLLCVPCRVESIRRADDLDAFTKLLREHNRQRVKSLDEQLREEVVAADPERAHQALAEYRRQRPQVDVQTISLGAPRPRARISRAKKPFLLAVLRVLEERREFLPLSDRAIHYALLNDPPLCHASKPASVYRNDAKSYRMLTDLLTRARLDGTIPMGAIIDATRLVTEWDTWSSPGDYLRQQLKDLFRSYFRDLMRSQPNHVEIVGEKLTVEPLLRPVAAEFTIPLTIGRGYSSLPPRAAMADRFRRSGKNELIILSVSDFDPEGENIGESFARSLRDDFNIKRIVPVKVALTQEQVERFALPPAMTVKQSSSRAAGFVARHGSNVWELEALPPEALRAELRTAIEGVIDLNLFEQERQAEHADAAELEVHRQRVLATLGSVAP